MKASSSSPPSYMAAAAIPFPLPDEKGIACAAAAAYDTEQLSGCGASMRRVAPFGTNCTV